MGKLINLIERILGRNGTSNPNLEANYEITFSLTDETIGECDDNNEYVWIKGSVYKIDEKGNSKRAGTSREEMIRRGEEMIKERFASGETLLKTFTLESYLNRTPGFVRVKEI